MSLILDPHIWLKKAVIITCTAAMLSQALVMPVQAIEQHLQAPAAAMLQIKDADPLNVFKSKSLSGDEVVFLSADNPAVKAVDPTLSDAPAASFMQTTEGEVVCAVSENPGMAANLGSRIIQIDSTTHGAIVEAGLTRLATSAHEYGHCLDILARKDISPLMQAAGLTPYSVPGVLINQAMASGTGTLDFNWLLHQSPQAFKVAAEAGKTMNPLSLSLLETYADLHGALQTAATTGDLRGFTEFEMPMRLNNLEGLDHTTALTVASVLEAELASGFTPSSLVGASHEAVTAKVNEIFVRHFTQDGAVSIHSDGFKSMVKEFQIKQQLGIDMPPAFSQAVQQLAQTTGAVSGPQDKALYVEMMQANVDHQAELVGKTAAGSEPVVNAQLMLTKLQTEVDGYRATLGVQSGNTLGGLLHKQAVNAGAIRDAALDFYVRSINLSGKGLTTTPANISKYADSAMKPLAMDTSPTL